MSYQRRSEQLAVELEAATHLRRILGSDSQVIDRQLDHAKRPDSSIRCGINNPVVRIRTESMNTNPSLIKKFGG